MSSISKRQFLRTAAGALAASATLSLGILERLFAQTSAMSPAALAQDETFWESIRRQYGVTRDFIQLENGYYSLIADPVLDAYVRHVRDVNAISSFYMRTRQVDDKLAVRHELARLLGCADAELIITRNTTESLDTVIAGFDWKPGDEAVMAAQDYGSMLDMFKLQARRHGMVNRIVTVPMYPKSDDEVVAVYENAITPKTRLLMVCHMINITGQILPVKKIVEMAHGHGVQVMVDGAHTFGQLDFTIGDLGGCDYYGSSLHKWLGAPLGAGILHVRRDRVAPLWPLYADASFADDDIRKLNHTGTHPAATDLAIRDAIAFHQTIGAARKMARLRHLQRYWTDKVRGTQRIVLNTPLQPERSCAIANVGVDGVAPADLAKTLFDRYHIFTVAIDGAGVHGVRVTPHLFTTTAELDALVKALIQIAA
ncbi:MAG TPA: aminotransferase class V-fold PLP-dependent enzyme [Rudaea sp.]|jgi:selenocysteine lyase/cysteine desulfurase